MSAVKERASERRWVVLGTDGRYVTLGRASDPSEQEIRRAEEALRGQGLAGWLAVMEGNPHVGALPRLMNVRSLADPGVPFDHASAACLRAITDQRSSAAD